MSTGKSKDVPTYAGPSTEQHITGAEETATFPTDEPPTSATPSHGSSNAGINERRANRESPSPEDEA